MTRGIAFALIALAALVVLGPVILAAVLMSGGQ